MTDEFESRVGAAVDRALGQELGLKFDPDWHPAKMAVSRTRRWQKTGWSMAVAAGLFLVALPLVSPVHPGQVSTGNPNLASYSMPMSVRRVLTALDAGPHWSVEGMSPIYDTYPMAVPTGHSLSLSGRFAIHGMTATSVAIQLNNHQHVMGGTLFNQGMPVYTFLGSLPGPGQNIATHAEVSPVKGDWITGTFTPINSFAAAGSNIYMTHNNTWTVMTGQSTAYWASAPGNSTVAQTDTISALPANPDQALLLEENPSGQSTGYITTDRGKHWTPWAIGPVAISNLVAMHHQYWAIINGTLMTSTNGSHWTSLLTLNTNRWQVEDYAINPADPQMIAAALVPVSGNGIGPVLRTRDNGTSWTEVTNFPALGAAPASMVMSPTGAISALINLTDPVLVRYSDTRQQWMILPVPGQANNIGIGQLAATPSGNLVYGAPGGYLYQWQKSSGQWGVIAPPSTMSLDTAPATPLQTIGNNQILAGYSSGWYIYVEAAPSSPTTSK